MKIKKRKIALEDLEVYQLAFEIAQEIWKLYQVLNWKNQKLFGDQLVRSAESMGANIAEGYGRYHYLDKIRFYYNARGSLYEVRHWIKTMECKKIIKERESLGILNKLEILRRKLNSFIKSHYNAKEN